MAFSRPRPIPKGCIFETNPYKKWHIRDPHTKYLHFRDPLRQKDVHPPPPILNGITLNCYHSYHMAINMDIIGTYQTIDVLGNSD